MIVQLGAGATRKTLEDLFFAVPCDGIGIAHETDGVQAEGYGVGEYEGARLFCR